MNKASSYATTVATNIALFPADKSEQKRRVMLLWEGGILTAGDVERLFSKHDLRGA